MTQDEIQELKLDVIRWLVRLPDREVEKLRFQLFALLRDEPIPPLADRTVEE